MAPGRSEVLWRLRHDTEPPPLRHALHRGAGLREGANASTARAGRSVRTAQSSRLAWEGHAAHASDREVRRHCCVSDPRRAILLIRTNLDFGSDRANNDFISTSYIHG